MDRDTRILALMPTAEQAVKSYLKACPGARHLADDLAGEAALAVVKVVGAKPDATASYVRLVVLNACRDFANESEVRVPRRSRGRGHDGLTRAAGLEMDALPAADSGVAELRESIDAACSDDLDRQIVALREAGHPDREIGAMLGMATSTVQARRAQIFKKLRTYDHVSE